MASRCRRSARSAARRYLIEKTLKSGVYLTCPNNKKPAASDEKGSKRKKKAAEEETGVVCHYSKRLRDAPAARGACRTAEKGSGRGGAACRLTVVV